MLSKYTEIIIVSRIAKTLNKTSLNKIKSFCDNYEDIIVDFESFNKIFLKTITYDNRNIKDCSERSIVTFYIEECEKLFDEYNINESIDIDDDFYKKLKACTRSRLAAKYVPQKTFDNNIDIYFNDVKREYILHPIGESEDIEFCPENKEVFIKNNLKLVIDCAKRYRNFGMPFEDLIQTGNVGLMTAFNKFDNSRANLRFAIIEDIHNFNDNAFNFEEAKNIIEKNFSYSKLLPQTVALIPEDGFASKDEFIDWTNQNIKKASFSSIAFAWIRAEILLELNKHANVIRIPKSAQTAGKGNINIVHLDSVNPHTEDNYHDNQISDIANDEFVIEDEAIEKNERQDVFKDLINRLMVNLKGADRRILKKRFGIDYPFTLSINEIAEQEGLSTNTVKYSIQNSMKCINDKLTPTQKELIVDMLR